MTTSVDIGQKLWNYCNILRDAGLSYGDYLEQLTYLLFLKMMHERTQPPYTLLPEHQPPAIPEGHDWPSLLAREGVELERHYRDTLEILGQQPGTLGVIFSKAQNRIQEPAMLTRLVKELIDSENWLGLSADVKGDAYESLLERNAQDVKTGAGQYFTPRPLIQAIVDVMRPEPGATICDPACGTGGFLLAAHDYVTRHNPIMDQGQRAHLRDRALHGWEIVDSAARLGVMNLYLHGIGGDETNIAVDDSLRDAPKETLRHGVDQSSVRQEVQRHVRQHRGQAREREVLLWSVSTSGPPQATSSSTSSSTCGLCSRTPDGRPWWCRTTCCSKAGQGRRCDASCSPIATSTRCCGCRRVCSTPRELRPTYCSSTASPPARRRGRANLWIYDLRTNRRFTLKANPLTRADLDDFVANYNAGNRLEREESERFHRFSYDELVKRDKTNLDIFWLRDESMEDTANLPPPNQIAEEIIEDLRAALEQLEEVAADLSPESIRSD